MSGIETLGYIGVGVMGGRMARNLAQKSGKPVVVYDANSGVLDALEKQGLTRVGSVAGLMQKADLVFMCLPGDPEVRAVCEGDGGVIANVRAGQTVVDMSTDTAGLARELAPHFRAKSADFADAPVARGVSSAEDGTLSIMVGADAAVFERIRPFLECMGTEITHCGGIGTGQVMKLMNNMVVHMNVNALAEAFTIATRAGVDGTLLFETLARGSADSFVLRKHGLEYMAKGDFAEGVFPITYSLKDMRYALQLAEETGVDAAGARLVEKRLVEAIEAGYGTRYSPVIQKIVDRQE